jgi:hypothetical protein
MSDAGVVALYVDAKGPYPALGVDCYDIRRDARAYAGSRPVIAHPPCKHWGRLRHLAHVVCLGCEHSYSAHEHDFCPKCGDGSNFTWSDRDCAPRAVEQVRRWGGVLEHPAGSKLWEACGLPDPYWAPQKREAGARWSSWPDDEFGGYTIELDQVEWGHVARKRTWLYLVGVPRGALEAPPFPGREPTHQVSRDAERAKRRGYTLKRTSTRTNTLTPPAFAEYLVRLARAAGEARDARADSAEVRNG